MTLYKQLMENKKTRQCPHCNGTIVLLTYPEIAHGDFDCPHCGAYSHSLDFSTLGRPGYFIEKDGRIENYMTLAEFERWETHRKELEARFLTIITEKRQE